MTINTTEGLAAATEMQTTRLRRRDILRPKMIVTTLFATVLIAIFLWPFLCMVGWSFNKVDEWMNPLWPIPPAPTLKLYNLMFMECGL